MDKSEPTIVDKLLNESKAEKFVKALSKYNLLSILGRMYTKKVDDETKRLPFTVLVPKSISIPKDEQSAINLLKSHIIKNRFDEESIPKICEKYGNDKITLSSMSSLKFLIDCKTKIMSCDGKDIKLSKSVTCDNGTYYIIDKAITLPSTKIFKETRISKPSILDILYSNKNTQTFVIACAKYNLCSMMCNRYFDKKLKSFTDFTVIAPKTFSLPKSKEEAFHKLRSHFIKRNFSLEAIQRMCTKLQSNGIESLKLGTMTDVQYEIDCAKYQLFDGKTNHILPETIKATNGYVYIIDKSLNTK